MGEAREIGLPEPEDRQHGVDKQPQKVPGLLKDTEP